MTSRIALALTIAAISTSAAAQSNRKQPTWDDLLKPLDVKTNPAIPIAKPLPAPDPPKILYAKPAPVATAPTAAPEISTTPHNKEMLTLMLATGGAIIGQSIVCGVPHDRLMSVMTVHAATIAVLSQHDTKTMKVRDDIIKLAAENEKQLGLRRCREIEVAFTRFETTLRNEGLMK